MPDVSPLLREFLGERAAEGRPGRIDRINRLLRLAWRRGWTAEPSLDPDLLIAKARTGTGLHDLGPEPIWRPSLELLTESLRGQARLNPLGRTLAHGQLVALLSNRLRLHALWRRHPEIGEVPTPSPIVILGQMRSGSTRVQRLLACDPRLAHTRFFESWNPVPRLVAAGAVDDRRLRAQAGLCCARLLNPQFAAIHPSASGAPDEEIGWHSISLFGSAFEAQWRVPDFAKRVERMDAAPVYAEFRRMLQTVAWFRRDAGRPWVLKVPQFTQDLPALLTAFPDARLVCLEREPEALVASAASLVHNQMSLQSDHADRGWIGREWLRKVGLREDRMRAALNGTVRPRTELDYAAISADWLGEMQRVYRFLDMPLTPVAERRMAGFVARSSGRRGHDYGLADFGLTAAEVQAALARPPVRQAA